MIDTAGLDWLLRVVTIGFSVQVTHFFDANMSILVPLASVQNTYGILVKSSTISITGSVWLPVALPMSVGNQVMASKEDATQISLSELPLLLSSQEIYAKPVESIAIAGDV